MTGPFNPSDPTNPANNPPEQGFQPPQANQGFPPPNQQQNYGAPQQGFPQQGGYQMMPKKKKKWPWILGGVVLFLVLALGACGLLVYNLVSGPFNAANDYYAALEARDYPAAYELVCESNKAIVTESQFASDASSVDITSYNFLEISSETGSGTVIAGTVTADGVEESVAFEMVEEEDGWKVCGTGVVG